MNSKVVLVVILLLVVLGGGYFAVKSMKSSVAPAPVAVQSTPQPTSVATSPAAMKEITVEGNEYAFIPSAITVKKGEVVKVNFKNTGKFPHNFSIADLSVKSKTIQPGEEDAVTFTADKVGSFTYICTVPGHADKGMKGTLTVK